jgi:hypothetical protein
MSKLAETLPAAAREHAAAAMAETTQKAHCMACGRSVNAKRAKLGGRHRFCSDHCLDAYDAGWPVYGTALADYATKTAHRKPVAAPIPKLKRKPRKRALQPRIAA